MVRIKEVKSMEIEECSPPSEDNFIIIAASPEGDDITLNEAILKEEFLDIEEPLNEESLHEVEEEHDE